MRKSRTLLTPKVTRKCCSLSWGSAAKEGSRRKIPESSQTSAAEIPLQTLISCALEPSGALRCGSCRRGAAGSAATSEWSSQYEKRDPKEKLNSTGRHLSGKILSSTSPPPMRTPPAARGARVPASQDDHEPTSSEAEREVTTRLHAGGHPRIEPLVQRTRVTCRMQRQCTATACGWKYTYESLWNAITNTIRVRIYCTIRPQISARPFIAYPQVLFM